MPEECRTQAADPPSSRAATVSRSDDPKSTGKRSRDPANSTGDGVSLEEWLRYARYCPWPRGRRGRVWGRRGMSAMEVAESMSKVSGGASRGSQRPRGRGHKGAMPQMVEECTTEAPRPTKQPGLVAFDHPAWNEEGAGVLGLPPPLCQPDRETTVECLRVKWGNITGSPEEDVAVREGALGLNWETALKGPRGQGDITKSADWDLTVKRPRLAEPALLGVGSAYGDAAVKRQRLAAPDLLIQEECGGTTRAANEGDIMPLESLQELGYPVSNMYRECEPTPMDAPDFTKESRPTEGPMEDPLAGKADSVTIDEQGSAEEVVEYPVAGNTGGEIANNESRPEERALVKPMAGKTDAEIALAKRWLPLRYPAYPRTGKFEDFLKYTEESKRIRELNKAGYELTKNLPTWGVESDSETETKASEKWCEEKDICLKAGRSVVAVSSVGPGHGNSSYCSGVIISCREDGLGTVRVLTSSGILYDDDDELHSPEQKVSVKLPNGLKHEGHVLYVNRHYNIAILKVCVGSSMDVLQFGSMPRYGQRVLALGRDSMDLLRRDGVISKLERTVLGRTHYMFPKSADGFPLICTGGPVIGEDGVMVGIITCHVPEAAMMSISIVQICLDMWKNYSCIARPEIKMNLRTVQMLPLVEHDKVQCIHNYNIQRGFIIDGVEYDSSPEKLGIRKGDVIEIVDENCGSTLPELETYLLEHGLRFLPKIESLSSTPELELKIRVYDLVEKSGTYARLSIPVMYEVALP
ncbi:hypothetical protein ACQ4PT_033071 [Festuca glaucescens]